MQKVSIREYYVYELWVVGNMRTSVQRNLTSVLSKPKTLSDAFSVVLGYMAKCSIPFTTYRSKSKDKANGWPGTGSSTVPEME